MEIEHKWLYYLSIATIFTGFLVIGTLLYWFYRPYDIIDYPNEPFPVVNSPVERGGQAQYYIEWCKERSFPAEVEFKLIQKNVDGDENALNRYILSQYVSSNVDLGCGEPTSLSPIIPTHISPGEYILRFEVAYHVNPIRTVYETVDSEVFMIK